MMATLYSMTLMAPTDSGPSGVIVLVVQMVALIAIFYFLLLRPQSQARKKHAALLAGIKKGDKVVTSGGVIGKIRDIKEHEVTIESGTAQLVVERSKIVQVGDQVAPNATP
jgi:preprotein translocase subunit YajC